MHVQIVHPEEKVACFIHGLTVGMFVDPLEELFTNTCVDIIKVFYLSWIAVYNAPRINMVSEEEFITHGFAFLISISLVISISHKMTCIVIEDGLNLVG